MFKKLVLIVIIVLIVMPVHAQDDDELVDYVQSAFTNVYEHGTYTIQGDQTLAFSALVSGLIVPIDIVDVESEFKWTLGVDPEGDIHAATGSISMSMEMQAGLQSSSMDLDQEVIFEGNLYFYNMSVDIEGESQSPLGAADGRWLRIDLGELDDSFWEEQGVDEVDLTVIQERLGSQLMPVYVLRIEPETVSTIDERGQITEDGRTMRVFDITLDNEGLLPEDIGTLLTSAAALQGMSTMDTVQGDEAILRVMDTLTATQDVYIDVETDLVYKVRLELTIDYTEIMAEQFGGDELEEMLMIVEINTTFSDIGAPFHTTPPKNSTRLPAESLLQ